MRRAGSCVHLPLVTIHLKLELQCLEQAGAGKAKHCHVHCWQGFSAYVKEQSKNEKTNDKINLNNK